MLYLGQTMAGARCYCCVVGFYCNCRRHHRFQVMMAPPEAPRPTKAAPITLRFSSAASLRRCGARLHCQNEAERESRRRRRHGPATCGAGERVPSLTRLRRRPRARRARLSPGKGEEEKKAPLPPSSPARLGDSPPRGGRFYRGPRRLRGSSVGESTATAPAAASALSSHPLWCRETYLQAAYVEPQLRGRRQAAVRSTQVGGRGPLVAPVPFRDALPRGLRQPRAPYDAPKSRCLRLAREPVNQSDLRLCAAPPAPL